MIDCDSPSIINKSSTSIIGKKDIYLYTPSLLRQFCKKKYIATRYLIQDVHRNICWCTLQSDIFLSRIKLLQTKCGVRENTFLTRYISTSIFRAISVTEYFYLSISYTAQYWFAEEQLQLLYKSLPVRRDAVPPVACRICRYIVRRRMFFGYVPPEGDNPVGWHAPRARCPPTHTYGNPP